VVEGTLPLLVVYPPGAKGCNSGIRDLYAGAGEGGLPARHGKCMFKDAVMRNGGSARIQLMIRNVAAAT
jgi:hypothetical protein